MTNATFQELSDKLDAVLTRLAPTSGRYLTIAHAAAYVDLSTRSIRRLIKVGTLTDHRPLRGTLLIDRIELERVVAASAGRRIRGGRGRAIAAAAQQRDTEPKEIATARGDDSNRGMAGSTSNTLGATHAPAFLS